ncbi:MAG: DUF4391 domain-containing protein [Paludibacteraceae bacterium]|nr:DUF4391 domain-containing protein [Paludibacteraceae bacterium]
MYGLPQSTETKKQLPKKAIYAKFDLKPSQRESFDADISRIDIVNVVSPTTIPAISEGVEVKEFYVLAVQMKRKEYDTKNLLLLTKLIPQRMVFALHFEDEVQFAVYHTKLITSDWAEWTRHAVSIQGLNFDAVWDNIVKSIGQIDIEEGNTLSEQIKADEQRAKILAQIVTLGRQMAREKQPRRKRELFEEIQRLKATIP